MAGNRNNDNNSISLKTKWGNRFIIAAIIQGGIITGMALATVAFQLLTADIDIIQYFCLDSLVWYEYRRRWYYPTDDICRSSWFWSPLTFCRRKTRESRCSNSDFLYTFYSNFYCCFKYRGDMWRYCLYNDLQIKNITLLTFWLLSLLYQRCQKC